jgi:beta-1,4-mannosyltransferase
VNGHRQSESRLPGRLLDDAAMAVRFLDALAAPDPIVLGYWPHAPRNPFQALLYRRLPEAGIVPVRLDQPEDASHLADLVRTDARPVLHLHWTDRILRRPAWSSRVAAAEAFEGYLDAYVASGGSVGWTVHNLVPHETPDPATDVRLQAAIAARASFIHVLAAETPDAAREHFTIPPATTIHVPHPSYAGAYGDTWSRATARLELGLPVTAPVLGLIGGIRAHKGLRHLVPALDAVRGGRPGTRLLVAGSPHPGQEIADFLETCLAHPAIQLHAGRFSALDTSLFLRALDVMVLPYERFLNSGVLMLALTFGLPVVAPDGPAVRELGAGDAVVSFTAGDEAGFAAAIERALDTPPDRVAADVARILAAHDPDLISRRFAAEVRARLAAAPFPPAG